jgi:hypothetical protein
MKRILLLLAGIACAGAALADADVAVADVAVAPYTEIGGNVRITQPVAGPVRVVGGDVTIDAPVNGSVKIVGGSVELRPAAAVSGDVSIAGGDVGVKGAIKGRLKVAGGHVRIDAPVGGNVSVGGGLLELGPNTRIEGRLRFVGGELRRDPAAQVIGGIEREEHARGQVFGYHEENAVQHFLHGWFWSAGLVVFAGLLAAVFPGESQRMALELRARPWITPLVGLLALTAIPVAAVLVMVTIIGIPIGLAVLLGYFVLLLIGYVWAAVVIGGMLLDRVQPEAAARTAWHAGAAALSMLVLAVLVRVPFVGGLVKLTALAVGVGMIVAVVMGLSKRAPSSPAPA